MAFITIPEALLKFTGGKTELEIEINSLLQFADSLKSTAPQFYSIVFSPNGKLCGFVNLYLEGQMVSNKLDQPIPLFAETRLNLVAAVSGG